MPPAEAVDYILQAAGPLAQMHDAGIVHRDVKPSNIFLARDAEGRERIKLLDFGVAAFQQPLARGESSITLTDAIVGTPRYMAPEQVRASKQVDARADVWALGVTLYELLAGRPPFDGQTVLAVLNQIEQQEPPLLAERQPAVSMALARVVHRCLAKDPSLRPDDARALAEALAPFALRSTASEETSARRPSDPLDLSLSDDNVEVVRPSVPAKKASLLLGNRRIAIVAGAMGLAAVALFALRGRARPPAAEAMPVRSIASSMTAETSALPSAADPPPAPSSSALVTSEPAREGLPVRRADPRAPAAPRRSGKTSPHPAASRTAHTPAEDDDRIE
jgi:serine/threonine-protein kinase